MISSIYSVTSYDNSIRLLKKISLLEHLLRLDYISQKRQYLHQDKHLVYQSVFFQVFLFFYILSILLILNLGQQVIQSVNLNQNLLNLLNLSEQLQ